VGRREAPVDHNLGYGASVLRRPTIVLALILLATATSASAALQPVRRDYRESPLPRVRAGTIHIPAGHAGGLTRVIVRLGQAPLAAWNSQRSLAAASHTNRLNLHTAAAKAYLAKLARAQQAAVAELRVAIPQARVQERYRIVFDGFAVELPYRQLPKLVDLDFATKVYPSVAYFATADRGPTVIHATDYSAATGDVGQGIKIGVVDTGVDATNPYLSPTGFSYPAGFPKGDTAITTPKVIVARTFPGPGSGAAGRKAFDPDEPHGTHVAGIAAGDAGTTAPAGPDHPQTTGLSGVAPNAWIGNYRVFTVPTPLGDEANTPEIIEAFEAAVADGMNVINFSGGGPQTDPANDAMYVAVHNTVLAGVVPVIAAGNDRDDFGLGTAGSPGTAPDAITVAATSNPNVFAPALSVTGGPPALGAVPIQSAGGARLPSAWSTAGETAVDVSTVLGTDRKPVEGHLCGGADDPNNTLGTLPSGSLKGKIALVLRGNCSLISKVERAALAGATGLIMIDNRAGEANPLPGPMPLPAGMISDLDGQNLRAFADANGGSASFRVSSNIEEIPTGRSGVITSFSSAGPTDFEHALKPDISAPGLDVLSSTPPKTTGSTFSVFAGTSMATPHVAGAAALLLQRHPGWAPWQVKSALMGTAGPAWGNTARTQEASVLLEGAGLANVLTADDPKIFTAPQSLSFGNIDVTTGAQTSGLLLTLSDAGDGAGSWAVTVAPQAQTAGVTIDVPVATVLAPGGDASLPVVVHAADSAVTGENSGFIVFTQNGATRRVPYAFLVERPALASVPAVKLKPVQTGSTATGASKVSTYCCPSAPFGQPPSYAGAPMNEDGSEHLYWTEIDSPVVNFGVSVIAATPGSLVDPFVLGSKDENDVQGYAATPTDVNGLTFDSQVDIGAAGVQFPRLQRFYVAVDSRADPFTNQPLKGTYILNSWQNDVTPPSVRFLTTRVTAGRPLLVARVTDFGAGVDPLSLVIGYDNALVGASVYDPFSGLAVFDLPTDAPKLKVGKPTTIIEASDFQESKNIETIGANLYPNTAFKKVKLTVVSGPAVNWILPSAGACALKNDRLVATATSAKKISSVLFTDNGKRVGVDKVGSGGVYSVAWHTAKLKQGRHTVTATVTDSSGHSAATSQSLRVCG
jgi:minor extracellular serine protease Vpr